MARDVIAFHAAHPEDWRDAFSFVKGHYGYDRYPGCCHIIPNSAVVILSLLYGQGDFSRSINICNMCGWDTDCNVANVGAIRGYLAGFWEDELVILKNERTLKKMASMKFRWEEGRDYHLQVAARGTRIELSVDGQPCLWAEDAGKPYLTGCYGLSIRQGSRCQLLSFRVKCE